MGGLPIKMSKQHLKFFWIGKIILAFLLAFSVSGIAFAGQYSTIFTYDSQDFMRTHTTLVTKDGKSAVNTKLDHNSLGYKALIQLRSYTGEVNVFGKKCNGSYAPLKDDSGQLTGALFVCFK